MNHKEIQSAKKIAIIGISGVGKSWLARRLAAQLHLPLVHYDTLCWDAHWTLVPEEMVAQHLAEAIREERWILEGYINPLAQERLTAADLIIYLDYAGWRAAWGGICRWWRHRKQPRPELAHGCEDQWSWERLWVMWTRDERREIEGEIATHASKVMRLRSRKETSKFFEDVS